ncbi:uncharacterized protein LOC105828670 isoform X2 [Monomorium pharaonis]|uniref:uncharacterized protein LOC105828670 isoform X2 n=1 Tax=Monomorium pharaonis TaxID=307658 RepID=UPI0017474D67|nr:uncharacterized protein LOC105828670 isoform X2 [Monomorium pharaonis]
MSTCRPLHYDNLSKYPYIDKSVSILDTDFKNIKMNIDFVYQFVKNSYQYDAIDNYNKSYITGIIGPPRMNYISHSTIGVSPNARFNVPLSANNFTEQNRINQISVINQNFIST